MRQQALISFGDLAEGKTIVTAADVGDGHFWIQMISGEISIGAESLAAGDGAAIEASSFSITSLEDSEFLLFELK